MSSADSRGVGTVPSNRAPKVEGRKILKNKQAPMQCIGHSRTGRRCRSSPHCLWVNILDIFLGRCTNTYINLHFRGNFLFCNLCNSVYLIVSMQLLEKTLYVTGTVKRDLSLEKIDFHFFVDSDKKKVRFFNETNCIF